MVTLTVNDLITARRVLTYFMCHHAMPDVTYFDKEKLAMAGHIDYVQTLIMNEITVIESEGDE